MLILILIYLIVVGISVAFINKICECKSDESIVLAMAWPCLLMVFIVISPAYISYKIVAWILNKF